MKEGNADPNPRLKESKSNNSNTKSTSDIKNFSVNNVVICDERVLSDGKLLKKYHTATTYENSTFVKNALEMSRQ